MTGPASRPERRIHRRGGEGYGAAPPGSRPPGSPPVPVEAIEHFERVGRVSDRFFRAEADGISRACRAMAARFHHGARLFVFGTAAAATDAYHVAVEFVHPVLVGKRALPAFAVEKDALRALRLFVRPGDIAMGISPDGNDEETVRALRVASAKGILTLGLCGDDGGAMLRGGADHLFRVPDGDPTVVQEVHETLYHILWELVHVFLDQEEIL